MHVLSVIQLYPPMFSGEARYWMRMIPTLNERGLKVDVLSQNPQGGVLLREHSGQLTQWRPPRWLGLGSYAEYLLAVMKMLVTTRGCYDAVLFHSTNADAFYAAVACRRALRTRIIYKMTLMGEDDPLSIRDGSRFGEYRLRLLRRADAVVSISPALTDSALRAGVPRNQLWQIFQGPDVTHFVPATPEVRGAIRAREGLPQDATVVLFVGALVQRKGIDVLLKAWQAAIDEHPNSLLLLVGPGSELELSTDDAEFARGMKQLARAPEHRASVRFLDFREDIAELFQIADIFVFPSRAEGMPAVVLEAMASGLPCVISDLPGVAGVAVRDGKEGLVVRMEDWQGLAAALKRLLADPVLARALGHNARVRAVSDYSQSAAADLYEEVFRTVVGRRNRKYDPQGA